jgi:Tfp pilus assembly protein PilO
MPTPLKKFNGDSMAKSLPAVTVLVALGLGLLAYTTLLAPKIARLRAGGEFDLTSHQARLEEEKAYAATAATAVASYGAVNPENRARVENIATSSPDAPGLYVQVDRIAVANGFQLATIDAVPDPKTVVSGERRVVRITINVKGGDYAQFKGFLADLERSERIIDVRSVIFTPASGSYSVLAHAYFVDPFAIPEPVAGAVPVVPFTP